MLIVRKCGRGRGSRSSVTRMTAYNGNLLRDAICARGDFNVQRVSAASDLNRELAASLSSRIDRILYSNVA